MRINDLIKLLDNRLKEFQLSRDYARMRGDLARMNVAVKEVVALEDTLYQLNLLADTLKSAAVKEAVLRDVIIDGSVAVLDEYDITSYATDPKHEEKVMDILSKMGVMDTAEGIEDYIRSKYSSSPVIGEMVMNASEAYAVDARLMMAIMEQDSRFGTVGKAVKTLNPGNVGNDDDGNIRTYESWQEGVTAVAEWLNRHRGSTITPEPEPADTIPPVITLVGAAEVEVLVGETYEDAGATAEDDVDGDITSSIATDNLVDTSILGTYTVTYTVSDAAGNEADPVTRTVNVVETLTAEPEPEPEDTAPPVITLLGEATVEVEQGTEYIDAGATAADDVDGDITSQITVANPVDTASMYSVPC